MGVEEEKNLSSMRYKKAMKQMQKHNNLQGLLLNKTDDDKINMKIKCINQFLQQNSQLFCIPGFRGLIKIANSDRESNDKLLSYLNHIWVIFILKEDASVKIKSVNCGKGQRTKPDIVFDYQNEEFVIEIKTIKKKGYDYRVEKEMSEWDRDILYEVPDKFDENTNKNIFYYQGNYKLLEGLIDQLDDRVKNIIIFITGSSFERGLDETIEDIDVEINKGHQMLSRGEEIPSVHIVSTELNKTSKNGQSYIDKYVKAQKIFVVIDEGNDTKVIPKTEIGLFEKIFNSSIFELRIKSLLV